MRSPIQYERQFILQIHCGINAFCFVVTLLCILGLRFHIGLIELLALLLPIVGILSLVVNFNLGKGRKLMRECYIFGSLSSILSLFLVSQVLVQFCYAGWLWGVIYFLLTGAALIGIIYFTFFSNMRALNKRFTPINLGVVIIVGLLVSIVVYRFFICLFFTPGILLFLSYSLWLLDLIITLFICFDLRILLFKGR